MKKAVSKLERLELLKTIVKCLFDNGNYVYYMYDITTNSAELWINYNQPSVAIDPRIVSLATIMELDVNIVYSKHKDLIVIMMK